MKEWLTVQEAAVLVGRHQSRIYDWINRGRTHSRTSARGVTELRSVDVQRIESVVKRGRPRRVPNR
jgi:transposase